MKKIFILFVLTLVPMLASADAVEIDGIYYNLNSDGKDAEVTNSPNYYSGEVVIPEKVTYQGVEYDVISIRGFSGCTGLTSITIPKSVKSIGNSAFYGCSGLTSITIPNSVISIGQFAFYDCSGLTSINIPNSVITIDIFAFYGCSNLTFVHITDLEAWCKISFSNEYSNPLCSAHHLYLNGEEIKDLVIPNNLTSIGNYAFYGCSGLTSVTIPNSVTSIGNLAFSDCTSLASVTIPNSVTSIGNSAFYCCSSLTSVTIPSSVTSIGTYAFYGCSSLTSIIIPSSVISIGSFAFYQCSSLTSVTIPNSVTSIGTYAFYGCSSLTSIIIPSSVTSIGEQAFLGCSSLTSITIPNSVTSIGSSAFYGCSGLTSVTIGSGIKAIYGYAFGECYKLANVYCYAEDVPYTSTNVFESSHPEYATLHVPSASLQEYKDTYPWSGFGTIVSIGGGGISKCATPSISYSDMKLSFSCETEGVDFISKMKDSDINDFYTNEINLTATYEISVYATKTGYENSDVATATLVWSNASFTETTPATAIEYVQESSALPVLIQNNGGTLTIQGAQDGTPISVYSVVGIQAGTAVSQNSRATINTCMQQGDIAIIKIGERSVKVVIK